MSSPAAVFSATERSTIAGLNTGALLVVELVRPEPGGSDQPESTSAEVARTRTS